MPALTAASVTDKQIRDLRAEAVQAGDWRQVDLCDVALGIRPQHTATDRGSLKDSSGRSITRSKARSACAKVISYAQGEAGHESAPSRHHATKKKSPAQLQREIDEALAKPVAAATSLEDAIAQARAKVKPGALEDAIAKARAKTAQSHHRHSIWLTREGEFRVRPMFEKVSPLWFFVRHVPSEDELRAEYGR